MCFVARWDRRKRPELFLELAERRPDVRFVAVGKSADAEWDAELRRRYAGLPNLEMPGFVDQFSGTALSDLLGESWILANTAEREGLPTSFLEAFAHGCAILSRVNPDGLVARFGQVVENDAFGEGLEPLLRNDDLAGARRRRQAVRPGALRAGGRGRPSYGDLSGGTSWLKAERNRRGPSSCGSSIRGTYARATAWIFAALVLAQLIKKGLRIPAVGTIVEAAVLLFYVALLFSLTPVRRWFSALPRPHRLVIVVFFFLAVTGQLTTDNRKTFPFPAWTMYGKQESPASPRVLPLSRCGRERARRQRRSCRRARLRQRRRDRVARPIRRPGARLPEGDPKRVIAQEAA